MLDPIVRHSYVQVNGSLVHLVQYGRGESVIKPSLSDSSNCSDSLTSSMRFGNSSNNNNATNSSGIGDTYPPHQKRLLVFVPGNPGLLGIYHDFLTALFQILGGSSKKNQLTILAIGHNDFDHPDHVQYRTEERICIDDNDLNFVERALAANHRNNPYHVELQVLNKIIILKRLLNFEIDHCHLVFIGHSIGCYVILRMLQDRALAAAHEGSVMIHPALENMVLTEKGSQYSRMFHYKLDLVLKTLALAVDSLLPKTAKMSIMRWFCSPQFVNASSEIVLESLAQLVCRKTLGAMIEMAKSEFAVVRDMSADLLIKPHVAKLKLVYAINDHWVNTDNRRMLRELYQDLYMEEHSVMHAFVMDPTTVMDYTVKVGMFVQDFIDDVDQNSANRTSNTYGDIR